MEQIKNEIMLQLIRYKEAHVRRISKLIRKPHANVSRALTRMKNENIVDSRDVGKNRVYFLKKGIETLQSIYIAEYYKLLKLVSKYPKLAVILEPMLEKTSNQKIVVVFGSYAKFNAKPTSDIDIFIETKSRNVKRTVERINSRLIVKIGDFDKSNLLIKEIVKNHVIVKGVEYFYENTKKFIW